MTTGVWLEQVNDHSRRYIAQAPIEVYRVVHIEGVGHPTYAENTSIIDQFLIEITEPSMYSICIPTTQVLGYGPDGAYTVFASPDVLTYEQVLEEMGVHLLDGPPVIPEPPQPTIEGAVPTRGDLPGPEHAVTLGIYLVREDHSAHCWQGDFWDVAPWTLVEQYTGTAEDAVPDLPTA